MNGFLLDQKIEDFDLLIGCAAKAADLARGMFRFGDMVSDVSFQ